MSTTDINATLTFYCPECNTAINHNYTQKDIQTLEYLDLTCQNCGYNKKTKTETIIEKIKEDLVKQLKKNFGQ